MQSNLTPKGPVTFRQSLKHMDHNTDLDTPQEEIDEPIIAKQNPQKALYMKNYKFYGT